MDKADILNLYPIQSSIIQIILKWNRENRNLIYINLMKTSKRFYEAKYDWIVIYHEPNPHSLIHYLLKNHQPPTILSYLHSIEYENGLTDLSRDWHRFKKLKWLRTDDIFPCMERLEKLEKIELKLLRSPFGMHLNVQLFPQLHTLYLRSAVPDFNNHMHSNLTTLRIWPGQSGRYELDLSWIPNIEYLNLNTGILKGQCTRLIDLTLQGVVVLELPKIHRLKSCDIYNSIINTSLESLSNIKMVRLYDNKVEEENKKPMKNIQYLLLETNHNSYNVEAYSIEHVDGFEYYRFTYSNCHVLELRGRYTGVAIDWNLIRHIHTLYLYGVSLLNIESTFETSQVLYLATDDPILFKMANDGIMMDYEFITSVKNKFQIVNRSTLKELSLRPMVYVHKSMVHKLTFWINHHRVNWVQCIKYCICHPDFESHFENEYANQCIHDMPNKCHQHYCDIDVISRDIRYDWGMNMHI